MKSRATLAIAIAACLTACSGRQTLRVPPSTPASLPAIPSTIDRDPQPLGPLADGTMGTLAVDQPVTAKLYGELAVRFNALRTFTRCIITQMNAHETLETCK